METSITLKARLCSQPKAPNEKGRGKLNLVVEKDQADEINKIAKDFMKADTSLKGATYHGVRLGESEEMTHSFGKYWFNPGYNGETPVVLVTKIDGKTEQITRNDLERWRSHEKYSAIVRTFENELRKLYAGCFVRAKINVYAVKPTAANKLSKASVQWGLQIVRFLEDGEPLAQRGFEDVSEDEASELIEEDDMGNAVPCDAEEAMA